MRMFENWKIKDTLLIGYAVQTAQTLREVNGAISQLNNAAQTLHQEIARFRVDTH